MKKCYIINPAVLYFWKGQVRGERYAYTNYFEQEPVYEFLHDLEADPDQLVNLAADPEYREILAAMGKKCDELKEKMEFLSLMSPGQR